MRKLVRTKVLRSSKMIIRTAGSEDKEAIWRILEPVIRAGETYPLPRDLGREAALAYWLAPQHEVSVAIENSEISRSSRKHPGRIRRRRMV